MAQSDGADSLDGGILGSPTKLVRALGEYMEAGWLLFGVVFVAAGVFKKIGPLEVQSPRSRQVSLAIGLIFVVGSVAFFLYKRREKEKASRILQEIAPDTKLPPEAYDPAFMMKVFSLGMPPAFVKRVGSEMGSTGSEAEDILYSSRYVRFQDSPDTARIPKAPDFYKIWRDHHAGDERAIEHRTSIQLEYPGRYVHGELRPILTFKRHFTHDNKSYIVGWYLPIDCLEEIAPGADRLYLRQEIDQVKFRLSLTNDKNRALTAMIGDAVKDSLGSGSAGPPNLSSPAARE